MDLMNKFVSYMKEMISGLIGIYSLYLKDIVDVMTGENVYSIRAETSKIELVSGLSGDLQNRFRETMLALEYELFGEIIAILGLMIAIKAMSMGIEEIVEVAVIKTAEEVLMMTFLGIIAKEMFKDIRSILIGHTENNTVFNKVLAYLHLSIAGAITVINLAEAFLEYFTKGNRFKFMAGFVLALTGYMLDAATKTMAVNGTALMYADLAGLITSLLGVMMMVYYRNRDAGEIVIEDSSPLISFLEWAIAIVGVLKAIADIASDYSNNWEG